MKRESAVEVLRHVVVRFDLRGIQVVAETQRLDEGARHRWPVHFRVRGDVCIEIADRAVELTENLHFSKCVALPFETLRDVGEFLAHRGGRGRLPMRSAQHRDIRERNRVRVYRIDQQSHLRQNESVTCILQRERVREIVDVFGGAGEMNEFDVRSEFRRGAELLFYEILDGLYVVVGRAFDLFNAGAVGHAEIGIDRAE